MKDQFVDIFITKSLSMLLLFSSFTILTKLNIELGIISSIGQLVWVMLNYIANTKKGRKDNYPTLYYVVSSVVAFVIGVFVTEAIYAKASTVIGNAIPVGVYAFVMGIMSDYTYEIVEYSKKQIPILITEARKALVKIINPE